MIYAPWILTVGFIVLLALFAGYCWLPRIPQVAEDFSDRPQGRSWIIGFVIPAVLILFGVSSLRNESFTIYGRGGTWVMEGAAATSFAITIIAAGAALHFYGIWGSTKGLWRFSELGKLISLVVAVVFMGRGLYLFLMT